MRDLRWRNFAGVFQKLHVGLDVEIAHVLGEAGAPADGVVQGVLLHEGAAALFGAHQVALFQRGDGPAHGMAVDVEAHGQLLRGRQLLALAQLALEDVGGQDAADLAPQRHTPSSFDLVHTTSLACLFDRHGSGTLACCNAFRRASPHAWVCLDN